MRIPLPALVVPIVMLLLYFFPGLRQMPWTPLRIAGAVVARTNYWLFLPFVALLVIQFARAGREAKVLQEKFERLISTTGNKPRFIYLENLLVSCALAAG
jgi:hypothetical protein